MAGETSAAMLRKVAALLELARDKHREGDEATIEALTLLGGGVGIGAKMKAITAAFEAAWRARYGAAYFWNRKIEMPAVKRLALAFDVDDLAARAGRYLADGDPFYVKARHPFALFASQINRYAEAARVGPRVVGCQHVPACQDDAEHTARRLQELRAVPDGQ